MSNLKESSGCSGAVLCKHCQSSRTRKYGFVEGTQTYFCNDCRRKFRADDHLFRMKTSYLQVASALESYYSGNSINDIRNKFSSKSPSSSKTIYQWITRFSREAVNQFKGYHLQPGLVWIASEDIVVVNGKHYRCLDVIDRNSHFLLAMQLTATRDYIDIKVLLNQVRDSAQKDPEQVLVDNLKWYSEEFDLPFGPGFKRIDVRLIGKTDKRELLEYWYLNVQSRTMTLKRLKSLETASKFLEVFRVWYNYLRPQESLDGKTPAEKAGIQYKPKSWSEILHATKFQIPVIKQP
jgi:transposase-like protein